MTSRPQVQIFNADSGEVSTQTALPGVFKTSIRPDLVHFVHSNIAKNKRQAYSVNEMAGHQTSATSWGTGRAVARIPRVNGGGTSRSGQAAFGNMCRGGRMFAPTKVWRKWHRKVNLKQRRYAVASALAASAVVPLVMARGHRVEEVAEIPLVISNEATSVSKTANAITLLATHGADDDVEHAKSSKKLRRGRGKMRNRRNTQRRGPLVVYAGEKDCPLTRSFRNIPGIEIANVERLNLLQLAPGGHLGRFIIWTQGAFEQLDSIYGTQRIPSTGKKGYRLPRPIMAQADLGRLINSDEVQSIVRPVKKVSGFQPQKKNPLKNLGAMLKLNPHVKQAKRMAAKSQARAVAERAAGKKAARSDKQAKVIKARRLQSKAVGNYMRSEDDRAAA